VAGLALRDLVVVVVVVVVGARGAMGTTGFDGRLVASAGRFGGRWLRREAEDLVQRGTGTFTRPVDDVRVASLASSLEGFPGNGLGFLFGDAFGLLGSGFARDSPGFVADTTDLLLFRLLAFFFEDASPFFFLARFSTSSTSLVLFFGSPWFFRVMPARATGVLC
jgi:hypothetical protein